LENMGKGRYKIKVHFDNAQIDALLAYNQAAIDTLTPQINDDRIRKNAAWDDYQYHLSYLTDFIISAGPDGIVARQDEVTHAMATVTTKKVAYDEAAQTEALSKLRLEKAKKEVDYLTKYCPKEIEAYAWCVAYNEDLTGDLASIEVDYVVHRDLYTQQIRDHTGFWLLDGQIAPTNILQHPLSTSEHANWFNLCMAPAAQRHKGLYRIATITLIKYDENKCNLYFDGHYDVDRFAPQRYIRDMPINPNFDIYGAQQVQYFDAEISYMGGGAETFLVGDKVIVDLHAGVGVPTVIGYYEDPRPGAMFLLFSDGVDYPFYWPTLGETRLNIAAKIIVASNPMLNHYADYSVSFNDDTPVYSTAISGDIGRRWTSTHGRLSIYNDNVVDGKSDAYINALNIPPGQDPISYNIKIYKLGVLVSDTSFVASGYLGDPSPHHVIVSQVTGRVFGVVKNGNEGYFSGDI